jgi:hypothetical protein
VSDVVDFLITQHDRIQELAREVEHSAGGERVRLFAEFDLLVNLHEIGDRTVVHPAARDSTPIAEEIVVACMAEEGAILRRLGELHEIGVGDAAFARKFAFLQQAIATHNAHEERDEFPLMRLYVKPQRLHMLVGQLHDIQVMGVA